MRDRLLFRRRTRWRLRKRWISRLLTLLFVLWAVDSLIIGDYGLYSLFSLKREEAKVQNEILAFQARREILERERRLLDKDLFTIERIAREQLGMIKSGEKKFLFLK